MFGYTGRGTANSLSGRRGFDGRVRAGSPVNNAKLHVQFRGWRRRAVKENGASTWKSMAMMSCSNTVLEKTHCGLRAVSYTGDFSDAVVIDANGRRIPWTELQRSGTEEGAIRSESPGRRCLNVVDRNGEAGWVRAWNAPSRRMRICAADGNSGCSSGLDPRLTSRHGAGRTEDEGHSNMAIVRGADSQP